MSRPQEEQPLRLRSKRNLVEKRLLPGLGWTVRKDFGPNREAFAAELSMVRRLTEAGVPVAPVLSAEEPVILYRYLPGDTLADLLEEAETHPPQARRLRQALPALARWLSRYYAASGGMVLGDAHLRNFLLSPEGALTGLDFEACRPGSPEEDAARLAVFTLTYHPPFTPLKLELAAELLRECAIPLTLRLPVLEQALAGEAEALCARRNAPPPWRDQLEKALLRLLLIISYSPVFR